jgi:hypothetical protein
MHEIEVKNTAGEVKRKSLGEIRCEVDFDSVKNPHSTIGGSDMTGAENFVMIMARHINMLEDMKQFGKSHPSLAGEIARWLSTAQTHLENAADMGAKGLRAIEGLVKAAEGNNEDVVNERLT